MNKLAITALSFCLVLAMACQDSNPTITLFDSDDQSWESVGSTTWGLTDGVLAPVEVSGQGFAVTKAAFGDFILTLEFKPDSLVNSGIFIRCQNKDSINATLCYEINICDGHANPDFRTGSIVGIAPPLVTVNTIGRWNTYEIKAEGNQIEARVNGKKTVSIAESSLQSGIIALQLLEEGTIEFRNVKLRPL